MILPDLVFITADNHEKIQKRIAPAVLEKFNEDQKAVHKANDEIKRKAFEKLAADQAKLDEAQGEQDATEFAKQPSN